MNRLYYGDNLDVLRRHIKDETVDLVYLDPPFKSNQDYNVLFKEKDGTAAASSSRRSRTLGSGIKPPRKHTKRLSKRADASPSSCRLSATFSVPTTF